VRRPTILVGESPLADSASGVLLQAGDVIEFEGRDAFVERLPEADAVVVGLEVLLTAELIARAERLRVIASRTSQLRHVDLDETARRGIAVLSIDSRAPVMRETTSTAEATIGLLLSLVRNIPWAFESVKRGSWERFRYGGREVRGKTLGIVGFGRLGTMVSGYAQALGMAVLALDRDEKQAEILAQGATPASLDELLAQSDVVSIHCTWSEETRGLIGAAQLASMRPGSLLLNTARGEIVDEDALLGALQSGHLGGAAIDTLAGEEPDGAHIVDNPLVEYARTHENLIILPHLGGATAEATERTQRYISEQLVEWLERNR
jgi:D-3-phosphoglycerate dehydrogenase / 2-oxoglutarate reductase